MLSKQPKNAKDQKREREREREFTMTVCALECYELLMLT